MTTNRTTYALLPIYDSSDMQRIKRTCNSIVHETKTHRERFGLADNLIVLADSDGDLLVYRIDDDGSIDPKVYWRNLDTGELVIVADGFGELEFDE